VHAAAQPATAAMEWTNPTSFRLANMGALPFEGQPGMPFMAFKKKPHESHPSFGHLVILVFEAVMEVVCVSLPGYIVARMGHFDADKQKFLANLNVMLFTPCLSMFISHSTSYPDGD
jgi:auxin efflux carrier family protein